MSSAFLARLQPEILQPAYFKSKLELESNLSEILPVNCKVIFNSTLNLI